MSEVVVVAVLPAAPGKEQRAQELLTDMTEKVKSNEPGATRYHLHKSTEGDTTKFVVIETYKDQAAFDAHKQTDAFKGLFKAMGDEGIIGGEVVIVPCTSVAGYEKR